VFDGQWPLSSFLVKSLHFFSCYDRKHFNVLKSQVFCNFDILALTYFDLMKLSSSD